jgi:hypothetical protein
MHKPPVDQDQTEGEYLRVELLPGDVLFIPRGHIHRGLPGGEGSLHLSVGIHVPTITDGIIERLREASLLDEVLRRPLSAGQQREDVINTTVQTLTQWNAKTPRQKHRVYLPENSLTSMLRIGTLALDDVLVRAGGKPLIYRLTPDFSTIEIDGLLFDYGVRLEKIARVALPAGYFSALQMINEKPDVTARSLVQALSIPITDALELGRKLLTIGVLEYQQC